MDEDVELRKIAVVTGARAEYGYLRPLIRKIDEDPDLELLLYVTGMHLLEEYGNTIEEVRKEFKIKDTVNMGLEADKTDYDMAKTVGEGIIGFSKVFEKDRPDIVIVLGDRIESFAAASTSAIMNIPIAHLHGGEVGLGDIDDSLRHAITKLAHLHFTSSKQSRERVLKLGEEEWRVFQVGAFSLDTILSMEFEDVYEKFDFADKPMILLVFHPCTTEWKDIKGQINAVLESAIMVAKEKDMIITAIYPNYYPGGVQIIESIKKKGDINVFKSLPHKDFLSLLKASSVFIGNSSSGILEAPSLGTPFVSVGTRQKGRERANNVIDVGYSKDEIIEGINRALTDDIFLNEVKKCESPYGDGKASERTAKVLREVELDKKLLDKKITY